MNERCYRYFCIQCPCIIFYQNPLPFHLLTIPERSREPQRLPLWPRRQYGIEQQRSVAPDKMRRDSSRSFNKHTYYGKGQHRNRQSDTCHALNPGIKHPGKCSRKQQQNQIFKPCLHGHNILFRTNSPKIAKVSAHIWHLPKFIEK